MNERQAWNITAIFLVLIFGLTAASILRPKSSFSEQENRALTMLPEPSAETVFSGSFEEEYEEYLADQFPMRNRWISARTAAEKAVLRKEIHDVYLASDGYLIEKHSDTFDTQTAERNIQLLGEFAERMAQQFGPEHVTVMMIPNAVDILKDKLPPYAAPYDEESYLESVRGTLPAGVWFDAGAVLADHKEEEIYYRTDHHWKTLGAFYVFRQWLQEKGYGSVPEGTYTPRTVTEDFQGTVASKIGMTSVKDSIETYDSAVNTPYVLTYNRTDDVRSSIYLPGALETKDKYAYFFGGNYGLVEAETKAQTGRRLLVIKDSYAHCFAPFLPDWFDEADFVDLRYFSQSLSEYIEDGEYTDILFLQNAAGFAEDDTLSRLTM